MDFVSFVDNPVFIVIPMIYFVILAGFVFYYAIKYRNINEKKDHPEHFINEMLLGALMIAISIALPFIYADVSNSFVKNQIYFHIWDSLTINAICWFCYFIIANYNNNKLGTRLTNAQFIERHKKEYVDNLRNDLTRKILHFITPPIVIGLYYICNYLAPSLGEGWTGDNSFRFMLVAIILGFLFALTIADLARLMKYDLFDDTGHDWMLKAIRPKELYTFNSAPIMLTAALFFVGAPMMIIIAVCSIGSMADAAACLVGKTWGKHHPNGSKKTLEGFIAGFVTCYAFVIMSDYIAPLGISPLLLHGMALATSFAFLLVDIYATTISDNFLNPVVTGAVLWLMYIAFV